MGCDPAWSLPSRPETDYHVEAWGLIQSHRELVLRPKEKRMRPEESNGWYEVVGFVRRLAQHGSAAVTRKSRAGCLLAQTSRTRPRIPAEEECRQGVPAAEIAVGGRYALAHRLRRGMGGPRHPLRVTWMDSYVEFVPAGEVTRPLLFPQQAGRPPEARQEQGHTRKRFGRGRRRDPVRTTRTPHKFVETRVGGRRQPRRRGSGMSFAAVMSVSGIRTEESNPMDDNLPLR